MAKVTLREISKEYNGVHAVEALSLEIEDGEFMTILGPPGAGKTSTLKMIAGVEPPSGGEILFDGQPMSGIPPNRRNIAMVFESYALYPHLTALENIAYPLRATRAKMGYTDEQIEERIRDIAGLLGIGEILGRRPAHLSGGQRQRVALARALVRDPQVFLFDEPIAHLDARLRHRLRGDLRRIQRELKTTTLYATPDYLEAIAMADRIAVLFGGELKQLGTPAEVMHAPASADVAQLVGDPPMNVLPAQVVREDDQLWFSIEGCQIPVPDRLRKAVQSGDFSEGILVGLRPRDVLISQVEVQPPAFPTELYVVEYFHRKAVLTLAKGTALITASGRRDFQAKVGERIWVQFPVEKIFVFDPTSGWGLTAQD